MASEPPFSGQKRKREEAVDSKWLAETAFDKAFPDMSDIFTLSRKISQMKTLEEVENAIPRDSGLYWDVKGQLERCRGKEVLLNLAYCRVYNSFFDPTKPSYLTDYVLASMERVGFHVLLLDIRKICRRKPEGDRCARLYPLEANRGVIATSIELYIAATFFGISFNKALTFTKAWKHLFTCLSNPSVITTTLMKDVQQCHIPEHPSAIRTGAYGGFEMTSASRNYLWYAQTLSEFFSLPVQAIYDALRATLEPHGHKLLPLVKGQLVQSERAAEDAFYASFNTAIGKLDGAAPPKPSKPPKPYHYTPKAISELQDAASAEPTAKPAKPAIFKCSVESCPKAFHGYTRLDSLTRHLKQAHKIDSVRRIQSS